jgi:PrgI family protein
VQYQVPQFIEVEDKIFGPLTFRQFVYLAGGGGACLALYSLLPLWLAVPLMIPFVALAAALAFYKINGRPFIISMEHAFSYFLGSKLYLWQQREAKPQSAKEAAAPVQTLQQVPRLSESKLRDLAWSLNIKDPLQESLNNQNQRGNFAI